MDQRLVAIKRLLDIMDELREKCPWDKKQTFQSLINNTVEETYELVDALTANDMPEVKKELGDLLLQIVFYSKIGSEQQLFDLGDVADAISDKLVYRHPHVFGEVNADNATEVLRNWEMLKEKERGGKGGVLSGVPRGLPPLVKSFRIQEKVAAVGFDWNKREDVWDKVKEEIAELQSEMEGDDKERMESEFGDLLFALVNAGRLYGISPEVALEKCNQRFTRRFNFVENCATQQGLRLQEMTLEQMEELWCEAKKQEKQETK